MSEFTKWFLWSYGVAVPLILLAFSWSRFLRNFLRFVIFPTFSASWISHVLQQNKIQVFSWLIIHPPTSKFDKWFLWSYGVSIPLILLAFFLVFIFVCIHLYTFLIRQEHLDLYPVCLSYAWIASGFLEFLDHQNHFFYIRKILRYLYNNVSFFGCQENVFPEKMWLRKHILDVNFSNS